MRELEFVEDGDIELDNILLLIAQTGTYIYTSFTIIGGNFSLDVSHGTKGFSRIGTYVAFIFIVVVNKYYLLLYIYIYI